MKLYKQTGINIFVFTVLLSIPTAYCQQDFSNKNLQDSDIPVSLKHPLKTQFGIKGGINFSNFSEGQYVHNKNLRIGYTFGVFAKLPITSKFFIQPELSHTTKGARVVYRIGDETKGEYSLVLNYIEAPISVAFRLDPALHIYAGGYIAYLTSSGSKAMWQDDESPSIGGLKREDFQSFDYGLLGGIGVDIKNFTLGMRYTSGLKSIGRSQAGMVRNLSNNALSVYVGFTI
jgi:hypothetical protein